MLYTTLLGLLVAGQASAAAVAAQRSTTQTVQLYAFGPEISGYAVYAGSDNLAYIVADEATSNLTALTWTIDTTGASAWTVVANSSSSDLSSDSVFYVVSPDSTTSQAGFAANTTAAPSGAVTTGFVTYGMYVMLEDQDTTSGHNMYASKFCAANTTTDGVWSLIWNGDDSADVYPVSLRTKAFIAN